MKDLGKKTIVLGIALIFILGTFIPAVGSEVKNLVKSQPLEKTERIEINGSDLKDDLGQTADYVSGNPGSVPLDARAFSLPCFNWSSSDDWRNGTSSQVYIRDGRVGIGGYDDFEDYSEGPLCGDWEERISSNWWTFYNYSGDMCLRHEGGFDNSRSMAITDQWGNISNSTIQVKVINVGDEAMCYLQSRVAWEKNTLSANCDSYACRNDLRNSRNHFEIVEYDDGHFSVLKSNSNNVEGTVYQKLMTVRNGVHTDLYAKVWPTSDAEPSWQLVVTDEVTNSGAEDGCFAVSGYTDDVFYVSDFWLVGGFSSGSHTSEWKNADRSVNWSTFSYVASDVSSGNQDIEITVQMSNDGVAVLDSLSFYVDNGDNKVDISSLPPAQYVRVITNFTTTDETKTAEISFYSIEFDPEIRISKPYPSNGGYHLY